MDTGTADDAVSLALSATLRDRVASPSPSPTPVAGRTPGRARRRSPAAPAAAHLPPPGHSGSGPQEPREGRQMEATRDRERGSGLTELEALCVWTATRLRSLTWAALVGGGYDPDVYDIAILTHRAARACAAARRAQDGPRATGSDAGPARRAALGPAGGEAPARG